MIHEISTLNIFLPTVTNLRLHIPLSYIKKAFSSGSTDQALPSPQVVFQREHNTVSIINLFLRPSSVDDGGQPVSIINGDTP